MAKYSLQNNHTGATVYLHILDVQYNLLLEHVWCSCEEVILPAFAAIDFMSEAAFSTLHFKFLRSELKYD